MLANDVSVNRSGGNSIAFAQHVAEPSRVQHGAGADNLVPIQARVLPYGIGEDVHRIGCDQEDTIEAIGHHFVHDGLHDLHVLANELQPRFTRLLSGTSTNDDHGGVGAIRVGAL